MPASVALVLLVWAGWIMYTSFKYGTLPVAGWETDCPKLFGTLWVLTFVIVLLPAYVYAIGLGILALLERHEELEPAPKSYWPVAANTTCLLILLTFCARVAVTAWFPGDMHPPLGDFHGGVLSGLIATLFMGFVTVTFFKVARSF